ncbi:MAG: M23 family metallopeptidase [Thermoleophilia bacterium]|nr:M23 family metallopeptidase [Thermoleophilia bacterium]
MTTRSPHGGARRRCRTIVLTLLLTLVLVAVSVAAYAVEQAGTPVAVTDTALGTGPEPSASISGTASVEDLERSYGLLQEESGRLRSVIEERGSRRDDKADRRLDWPVEGDPVISSGFGPRLHPVLGRNIDHEGIDLALALLSPVKAAGDGEVIYISNLEVHGTTLVIDHGNGLATVYCHLTQTLVEEGTRVDQGQVVAESGMTGLATGPHLHFEVRDDGRPENPREFLPRLLPQTTLP